MGRGSKMCVHAVSAGPSKEASLDGPPRLPGMVSGARPHALVEHRGTGCPGGALRAGMCVCGLKYTCTYTCTYKYTYTSDTYNTK